MMFRVARMTLRSRLGAAAVGAGIMYFADPDRGRSRRTQTVSRAQGIARRKFRSTARKARGEEQQLLNRLEGAMVQARGGGRYHAESDVDLREHLHQVIRSMHLPGEQVNVDAERGTVSLRGQVTSLQDRTIILEAVRKVDGVARIEDFTHLPGEVAPNKASVIRLG